MQDHMQLHRIQSERQALTYCIIKTMSRDSLENILVGAAPQFPPVMNAVIASISDVVNPGLSPQQFEDQTASSSRAGSPHPPPRVEDQAARNFNAVSPEPP